MHSLSYSDVSLSVKARNEGVALTALVWNVGCILTSCTQGVFLFPCAPTPRPDDCLEVVGWRWHVAPLETGVVLLSCLSAGRNPFGCEHTVLTYRRWTWIHARAREQAAYEEGTLLFSYCSFSEFVGWPRHTGKRYSPLIVCEALPWSGSHLAHWSDTSWIPCTLLVWLWTEASFCTSQEERTTHYCSISPNSVLSAFLYKMLLYQMLFFKKAECKLTSH